MRSHRLSSTSLIGVAATIGLLGVIGLVGCSSGDVAQATARFPARRCGWSVDADRSYREWAAIDASSATNVWAVGGYYNPHVQRWDGKHWSLVDAPEADDYFDLRVFSATDVWLVGDRGGRPFAAHLSGTSWQTSSPPVPAGEAYFTAVDGTSSRDIWAVGHEAQGKPALTTHWNGAAWRLVGNPLQSLGNNVIDSVAVTGTTSVWATGRAYGRQAVLHWNGRRWSVVRSPALESANLNAVAGSSDRDVWVVGSLHQLSGGGYAAHWNGKTWSKIGSAYVSGGSLSDISVLSAKEAWAVGDVSGSVGAVPLVEHWNGRRWTASLVETVPEGQFEGVTAVKPSDVWAVGYAIPKFNDQRSLIAHRRC